MASLGVLAEERHQRLTVDVADGVVVVADRLVLREAITNVVDNAIKYSPPASTIDDSCARATATRRISTVADEGPGIAPEHRERIFDRFFRLDEGRSRDSGGTGLGLAIAKWAVEVNGGRITRRQRRGRGALSSASSLPIGMPPSRRQIPHYATQPKGEHV